MRDRSAVNRMVEQACQRYGRIDILVNNAGQAAAGTVAEVRPDDFRSVLELNVFGVLYAIQAVVPVMRQGSGGLILNVSSMVSKMRIPGLAAYTAPVMAARSRVAGDSPSAAFRAVAQLGHGALG
jgi:NADP-dependent 3-hydroxy acid dehydrogenase YdfG